MVAGSGRRRAACRVACRQHVAVDHGIEQRRQRRRITAAQPRQAKQPIDRRRFIQPAERQVRCHEARPSRTARSDRHASDWSSVARIAGSENTITCRDRARGCHRGVAWRDGPCPGGATSCQPSAGEGFGKIGSRRDRGQAVGATRTDNTRMRGLALSATQAVPRRTLPVFPRDLPGAEYCRVSRNTCGISASDPSNSKVGTPVRCCVARARSV